jgi:integral membrane protein (TIGR00529 family)
MWPLLGLTLAFLAIFVLVLRKVHIGLALVLGSGLLAVLVLPVDQLPPVVIAALTARATLELVATISAITFLNYAYQQTGRAQHLAESLGKLIPPRGMLVAIPALFGVLPVSGGALFSAPFVDAEGGKLGYDAPRRAFLNLWFRHVPHLIYPLETALVVTAYLTGVPLPTLILYQLPVFVTGMLVGVLVALRGPYRAGQDATQVAWRYVRAFLLAFAPILLTVGLIAVAGVPVYVAVLLGAVLLFLLPRFRRFDVAAFLPTLAQMALVGIGIVLFRTTVERSGVLTLTGALLQALPVWPPLLAIAVPFLVGVALGESSPAITFSLSLLGTLTFTPPVACLAYTAMYFGHLLSPIHLCFAVTAEYFHAGVSQIYTRLVPAIALTLAVFVPLMLLLL